MANVKNDNDLQFKLDVAQRLATIETQVKSIPDLMKANHDVITSKLEPVLELHKVVQEHDRQISRWQGVNGVLGFLLMLAAGAIGKIKHWI